MDCVVMVDCKGKAVVVIVLWLAMLDCEGKAVVVIVLWLVDDQKVVDWMTELVEWLAYRVAIGWIGKVYQQTPKTMYIYTLQS